MARREWIRRVIEPAAYEALASSLPASRLWSLLLDVFERRATRRAPSALVEQWRSDRFVEPSYVDQRTAIELDRHLLAAARAFEAIELSPVAPLGVCSVVASASQNKVLSTVRGTEVVSDPTNVMALECARRLHAGRSPVRLVTSHRCLRAQAVPKLPGFAAHFRIFCLASAAIEEQNHASVLRELTLHLTTLMGALDRLEEHGYAFPDRRITVLASATQQAVADRLAAELRFDSVSRAALDHEYYDGGIRFRIDARDSRGAYVPLIDGGVFTWVARLLSNRRAIFVASGMGSQLVAALYRRERTDL